jgi:hypothetical protein
MDKLKDIVEGLQASLSNPYSLTLTLIVGAGALFFGISISQIFNRIFLGLGADKTEPDKAFENGLSYLFIFKVFVRGPSLDSIVKILSERIRRRLYVAHKHWLFFGDETWWVGHPAIAAHAFGVTQLKMWRKLTKTETMKLFYSPALPEDKERKAMLYTGDDESWRNARAALTPFFYTVDFSKLDERMDSIVQKHILKAANQHHGEAELLELLLTITVDLLCQCLYRCALPLAELKILTDCMAEYIVPGAANPAVYPGGLNSLE